MIRPGVYRRASDCQFFRVLGSAWEPEQAAHLVVYHPQHDSAQLLLRVLEEFEAEFEHITTL